jgi:hypothetical protein
MIMTVRRNQRAPPIENARFVYRYHRKSVAGLRQAGNIPRSDKRPAANEGCLFGKGKSKAAHISGKRADNRNMKKRVNYEDNTFIINTRIRLLQDIFLLEADSALFFDKTLDELDFINNTLEFLLKDFMENDKLIERSDRFHDLLETEWRFTSVLNFLVSGQGSLAEDFYPRLVPKLKSLLGDCVRRQNMIEAQTADGEKNQVDERLVSSFELSELLKE